MRFLVKSEENPISIWNQSRVRNIGIAELVLGGEDFGATWNQEHPTNGFRRRLNGGSGQKKIGGLNEEMNGVKWTK